MKNRQTLDKFLNNNITKSEKIRAIQKILEIKKLPNHPNCNCVAHALNFCQSEVYYKTAKYYLEKTGNRRSYFASPTFLNFLLQANALTYTRQPFNNSLIVYFDEKNDPIHAGIIKQQDSYTNTLIIESQWGTIGCIEHKIWDIPASYGNQVRFYNTLSLEIAEAYFKEFCYLISQNTR